MPDNTRREFLRLAAAASLAGANPGFLQAAGGTRMQGWMTSQDQKLEEVKLRESRTFSGDNANGVVIDATKRYQEVLGFGAAFTDAAAACSRKWNQKSDRRSSSICLLQTDCDCWSGEYAWAPATTRGTRTAMTTAPTRTLNTNNGACPICQGAVTIEGNEGTRNLAYYTIAHFPSFCGRDRIDSSLPDDLPNASFQEANRATVLVVAEYSFLAADL